MAENGQGELAQAYAMLLSLRKNIDQMSYNVLERYVREFHTVLTKLEDIGIDVSEFRIPDSEVTRRIKYSNILSGGEEYTKEKYVYKTYLLTKIDALIGYLEITTSEKPKKIDSKSDNS